MQLATTYGNGKGNGTEVAYDSFVIVQPTDTPREKNIHKTTYRLCDIQCILVLT